MTKIDEDCLKMLASALASYFEGGGKLDAVVLRDIDIADFGVPMSEFFPDTYLRMCAAGWF